MIFVSDSYIERYGIPKSLDQIPFNWINKNGNITDSVEEIIYDFHYAFYNLYGKCMVRKRNGVVSELLQLEKNGDIRVFYESQVTPFKIVEDTDDYSIISYITDITHSREYILCIKEEKYLTGAKTLKRYIRMGGKFVFSENKTTAIIDHDRAYMTYNSDRNKNFNGLYKCVHYLANDNIIFYFTKDMKRVILMFNGNNRINGGFAIAFNTSYISERFDILDDKLYGGIGIKELSVTTSGEKMIIEGRNSGKILCTIDFSNMHDTKVSFANGKSAKETDKTLDVVYIKP
jgi:hypothetical protein